MSLEAADRNPFMLMLNPEVIFAAVEKSERLAQLNRHLCRPLDRPAPAAATSDKAVAAEGALNDDDDTSDSLS
ncbi:MAG TPA: hypothetical protein VK439_16795 [Rubrivivax sp.]|nr:hypothetical protein [Rubrivivax sp.]